VQAPGPPGPIPVRCTPCSPSHVDVLYIYLGSISEISSLSLNAWWRTKATPGPSGAARPEQKEDIHVAEATEEIVGRAEEVACDCGCGCDAPAVEEVPGKGRAEPQAEACDCGCDCCAAA